MPLSVTPLVLNGMHQPVQPRIRRLKPCQEDQARRPLHEAADGRAIPCPFDEVAFPVARHGKGGYFCVALGTWRHVGDLYGQEASGQLCPDVPPQPGLHEHARPPPGMRRQVQYRGVLSRLFGLSCLFG